MQGQPGSADENVIPRHQANVLPRRDELAVDKRAVRAVQVFYEIPILYLLDYSVKARGQSIIEFHCVTATPADRNAANERNLIVSKNKEHAAGFAYL